MREYERKDMYKLEGTVRIAQGECDKCSSKGSAECKRYKCPKWNKGWVVEEVSYGGSIDVVRTGLSFDRIKKVYPGVLEEIRKKPRQIKREA